MKDNILIVEDERSQSDMLVEMLTDKGISAVAAADGCEALEKFRTQDFDLLITDLQMPRMDGIELMKEVRKSRPNLPIIIITGYVDLELAIDVLNSDIEGIFRKPFDMDDLVLKVHNGLRKRRLTNVLLQSAKMTALGELTASIAHELRNALSETNMAGNILLKKHADFNKNHQRYLDIMVSGVDRANRLIEHLLTFSRSSEKKAPVILEHFFDSLLTLVDDRIRLQGITVERKIGDLKVNEVVDSMNIIFLNLITNAIQAMEEGGGTLKIDAFENGRIVVKISDTGCGIPPETQGDIFETFFTTKGDRGNGLGLYIVKKEVESIGGEIVVESEVGKGTTFSVIFSEEKDIL